MYLDASGCMLIMFLDSQKLVEHAQAHATFYSITPIRMERWPFLGLVEDITYRGGPHMRSLISIDFPAPEMEPESAHVASAVSVP